jgi:hypothetical protein
MNLTMLDLTKSKLAYYLIILMVIATAFDIYIKWGKIQKGDSGCGCGCGQ